MKIAIIGVGNLGLSIAKGIIKSGLAEVLYLSDKYTDRLQQFASEKVIITSDNIEAIDKSDIVIFSVQPAHIGAIMDEVKSNISSKHTVMSTIAGYSIDKMATVLGQNIPIIRVMPNTAISVGKSMTCLSSNKRGEKSIAIAKSIFDAVGHTLVIPEHQMQAATVICASGTAFWMRLIRATMQGAIQLGFESQEAQQLAMYTCNGAAELLIASGNHPEAEIDRVTTPAGCTIRGLNEMENQGMSTALVQGIVASFEKISRIKEKQL
ncbi:MAG: pyrroline-5-carboxylate reductase [Bacteroidota bacterium]